MIEHIVSQMEEERGIDRAAAIADMRFDFIQRICRQTVVKPAESKERIRSRRIDAVLTGKYTAIPTFILIMGAVFFLTFNVIGAVLQNLLGKGIDYLTAQMDQLLTAWSVNTVLHSLVIDGIKLRLSFHPLRQNHLFSFLYPLNFYCTSSFHSSYFSIKYSSFHLYIHIEEFPYESQP